MPYIPNMLENVIARGLLADRPAALMAGRLYYATDEEVFYRDNGTGWDELPTGAVDSVDGQTGDVDLSGVYDALGAADAAVEAHNAQYDMGVHAKPGAAISQGYEEDGADRIVAAADTSFEALPSLAALDPITPANDSWEIVTFFSADTAGIDVSIRVTVTDAVTLDEYTETQTITTSTATASGFAEQVSFFAAGLGLPYPYPALGSVTWEWALPDGEGAHLYSGARAISWLEPAIDIAHLDDIATAITDHEAAADPHPGYVLESAVEAKGDLYVGTAADTVDILTVGDDGQILVANMDAPAGIEWVDNFTTDLRTLVKNNTGTTLYKGQAVYISGATGSNVLISLADADTEATSSKTLGLLLQDLENGDSGYVIEEGLLAGVDTDAAATEGVAVWLSSMPGGRVYGSPPAEPAHSVYLGVVARKHATVGEILVKVQNGYELDELHNVSAASPDDNDLLAFDTASGMWKAQTAGEAQVEKAGTGIAMAIVFGG